MPTSVSVFEYNEQIEYNASNQPIYQGVCKPTTGGTAKPLWAIKKFIYDGNNVIAIRWANGNQTEDKEWDQRSSYDYS